MVSLATGGGQGNADSLQPTISDDGRYVAFDSEATTLVTPDANGVLSDIFVYDRQLDTCQFVSVTTGGVRGNNESVGGAISGNGRFVAFESDATDLVVGDNNNRRDVFLRDFQAGTTTRMSLTYNGSEANAGSGGAAISNDGRYVSFNSIATNLTVGYPGGSLWDVFVRDRQVGTTEWVSVHTSGAQGDSDSLVSWISGDGRYVSFHSLATNLVDTDTNLVRDAFVHDRGVGLNVTPFFHERQYLEMYPDIAAAVGVGTLASGLAHFQNQGMAEGRDPSRFFNGQYYRSTYPDVDAAVVAGTYESGFEHYLMYGGAEGRNPSTFFDEQYYLATNSGVAAAADAGEYLSVFQHYMKFGAAEGRSPSPFFNEAYYRAQYAGVAAAIIAATYLSGLEHFLVYGAAEGRNTTFNEQQYRAMYSDVDAGVIGGTFVSGLAHYLGFGAAEGRFASPLFSGAYYLALYADVAGAVAAGAYLCGLEHFIRFGQREGRLSTFNEQGYRVAYPIVAAAIISGAYASAYAHWYAFGRAEAQWAYVIPIMYILANPDVYNSIRAGVFLSALMHFAWYGQFEGRNPRPTSW